MVATASPRSTSCSTTRHARPSRSLSTSPTTSVFRRPGPGVSGPAATSWPATGSSSSSSVASACSPPSGDRHLAEFFPGFLTEASDFGKRWGVELTTIEDREASQASHVATLEALIAAPEVSSMPSGELVAPLIDSLLRDHPRDLPLNLPNAGQCPDLPPDVVVESVCIADGSGVHGRDRAQCPPGLAEHLRRVSASQELTVEAALNGSRDTVFEAMLADPLAGRIDWDQLRAMTDEMLDATAEWLPQFT